MSGLHYQRRVRRHGEALDYISDQLDSILSLILSFTDTKSAVKTSVLSKRWKYVWTNVPTLKISDDKPDNSLGCSIEKRVYFKSFVNNVLLCNDVSNMQKLKLKLSRDIDALHVKSWLNATSLRKSYEIDFKIDSSCDRDYFLPARFFCSDTLLSFKLKCGINVSSSVTFHLPRLQTIHLKHVRFPDDEFMRSFSSSCPLLRELHIVSCWGLSTTLHIDSLTLESLQVSNVFDSCNYHLVMPLPCISIKAPNLRYLALDNDWTLYDIVDMTLLNEAIICLHLSFAADAPYSYQILSKVSGVKTLQLRIDSVREESNLPAEFGNLTCLKLEPDSVSYSLLKRAPRLERLILESTERWNDWLGSNSAPERLPFLESVEICWFVGDDSAYSLVEYFLKAAPLLKEIIINMYTVEGGVTSAKERLLMLPRSSPNCQVITTVDGRQFPYFCTCY